jgi:ribonuclease J
VFVDGSGVGDIGKSVIRDRETLARDGFIFVVVNVDRKRGTVIGEPEIISRGFVYLREADELMKQVRNTITGVIERSTNGATENGRLRDQIQDSVSKVLYNETKRRPMVFSVVNER